jgi:hypothetical protein
MAYKPLPPMMPISAWGKESPEFFEVEIKLLIIQGAKTKSLNRGFRGDVAENAEREPPFTILP